MSFRIQRKRVKKSIKEYKNLRLLKNKLTKPEKDIDLLLIERHCYSSVL